MNLRHPSRQTAALAVAAHLLFLCTQSHAEDPTERVHFSDLYETFSTVQSHFETGEFAHAATSLEAIADRIEAYPHTKVEALRSGHKVAEKLRDVSTGLREGTIRQVFQLESGFELTHELLIAHLQESGVLPKPAPPKPPAPAPVPAAAPASTAEPIVATTNSTDTQ